MNHGGLMASRQYFADALDTATVSERCSHLAALSRLARHAQDAFEAKSSEITTFLLKDVLMVPIEDGEEVSPQLSLSARCSLEK